MSAVGSAHDAHRIVLDGVEIGDDTECYVIAEIGHNHQGSVEQAKELFEAAKELRARTRSSCRSATTARSTPARPTTKPYENENSYGATYGEHREALEFGRAEYEELQAYARELGITFFATAFDFASADFLAELDMPAYKIASGDLTNTPLLRHVARIGKPMILSTGGGTIDDVRRAYETLAAEQRPDRRPPVHRGLSGRVGRARPARDRDLPRASSRRRSSASRATTTGSRWPSPPTCSAPGSSRSTSR